MDALMMQNIEQYGATGKQYDTIAGQIGGEADRLSTPVDESAFGELSTAKQVAKMLTAAREAAAGEIRTMSEGMQVWETVNTQLQELSQNHITVSTAMLNTVIWESGGK